MIVLRCPSCHAIISGPGTCEYCGAEVKQAEERSGEERAGNQVHGWVMEARELVAAGRKIEAILMVRWHTEMGLREAKDLVESGDLDDPVRAQKLPPGKAGPLPETTCFPATAMVATPRGDVSIAQLDRGDDVWGWDRRAGLCRCRVTARLVHEAARLWRIGLDGGGEIMTTRGHSFLSARGWLRTERLAAGDAILTAGDAPRVVVQVAPAEIVTRVYNLHTSGPHTFLVDGVVAHNFTHLRSLRTLVHRLLLDPARARRPRRPLGDRQPSTTS